MEAVVSADLPNSDAHRGSYAMARYLVTYLDDPRYIRAAIKREFPTAPTVRTIAQYRAEHLASQADRGDQPMPCDGYWPSEIRRDAERRSARFLEALALERYISRQAGRQPDGNELASTLLTEPKHVDGRWKRLIEKLR